MSPDDSGDLTAPSRPSDRHETPCTEPSRQAPSTACAGCPQEHACRDVWAQKNDGPFTAGGLVLASMLVFLLPLVTAAVGGVLVQTWASRPGAIWPLAGAAGGLVVGVVLARLIMPALRKRFHVEKSS